MNAPERFALIRGSAATEILESVRDNDPGAAEQLMPLVYDEPRKLAAASMAGLASVAELNHPSLVPVLTTYRFTIAEHH